jgi:deazaflavin-dependent oxidoreductase (nitroreductase family)
MADDESIHDSPTGWVAAHIRDYVATDGRRGHRWRGVPTLLITTVGRRSGLRRRTALIYGEDGVGYVVVASRGGHPRHPAWFLNLESEPDVEVQVGANRFAAMARVAAGEERERLWATMVEIWPAYEGYQAKTPRQIPIVLLTPS